MSPATYLPSFAMLSEELGIPWCHGILKTGHRCHRSHRPGSLADGVVHFTNRRVTRAGIRRFLFLGAMAEVSLVGTDEPWRRFYWANQIVTQWVKQVRIEMPRSATAPYKTQLKAMLASVEPGDPEREEAWLWASR